MKKIILIVFCFCICCFAKSQTITAAEYFVDTDPGVGNGIQITVPNSATSSFTATVPTTALADGFHFVAIRTKDSDGKWSLVEKRGFYISNITNNVGNITSAEFFVDTDPGPGNGTPINVPSGSISTFIATVPTNLMATGFHFIAIRTKDSDGKWGLFENRGFYISKVPLNSAKLIAAEYFFDTDPGVGNGIPITFPSPTTSFKDSLILPLGSLPLGSHQIAIRAKDSSGKWGLLENKAFKVCTTYGPLSLMNFLTEGNQVFFTNTSIYNDTTRWEFGDNTLDTILNPIKTYSSAGNYLVRLISTNGCGKDTLTTLLSIFGIQRINANKGGNAGVASVIFEGNGFTPTSILKLQKGSTILLPSDKKYISSNRVLAYFDLNGADTGRYNVVANLGGGPLDTLKHGFYVQQGVRPLITIEDRGGRNPERFGRMGRLFGLQNQGNEDAIMLPFVTGIGYNAAISDFNLISTESFVDLSNQGIFQNTFQYLTANGISANVMAARDVDTIRKKQILAYYKVKIPAESFSETGVRISNGSNLLSYSLGYLVQPPLYKSGLVLNDPGSPNSRDCMNSFLKKAVKKNLNVQISDTGWNSCFNTAFDTLTKSIRNIVRNLSFQNHSIPMKAMYSGLLVQMSQCGSSGLPANLTTLQFEKIIKDVTYNWAFLENLDSIGRPCFDTTETFVFNNNAINQPTASTASNIPQRISTSCDGGAGSQFPELAEICKDFAEPCEKVANLIFTDDGLASKIGKKIFLKLISALTAGPAGGDGPGGGFCGGLNSGSAACKKLCEQGSVDPNVKYGPGNNDDEKYVNSINNYGYSIFFENLATATAPAAYVEVTDTLDKSKFDLSTFQAGTFGWGDSLINIDANRGNFSLLKDLRPGKPNKLRVDIRLDTSTGIVKWKFFTLDLVTLQLTDDPLEGFLPPNTDGKKGQAFVTFSIKPAVGITSGAVINNKATIVFDENAAINTGLWQHIIDTTKPQSQVGALADITTTKDFVVNWNGTDAHSGVDKYLVYVSVNDSLFTIWKGLTAAVSDTFHGQFGNTYKFVTVVLDKAGNYEDLPNDPITNPDAATTVLAIGQFISVQNGLWSQPATWSNNQVPTANNDVIIKHQVNVDVDAECKSLKGILPGVININAGKRLDIKGN